MGKSSCVGHTRSVQACAQPSTAASCVKCCRGMTDSRHYNDLAEGRVYRFCPHRYPRSSIQLVHGVDERIAGAAGQGGAALAAPAGWFAAAAGPTRAARAALAAERLQNHLLLHSFTVSQCPATHTPHLPWACLLACLRAVEDFLRGIGFYSRLFELATADESSEEAAAAAAAGAGATAAE
jgi:hypothetical protein